MEGDDNFVMNINMGSNIQSNKMTFMSQNEKRKNKKEKFMERRMLTNKRRRENNANKKTKTFNETKKNNNINKVIENNNTDISIDENIKETILDNQEEQNQQEKKQKQKLTQKQKNEQQLHREQLTEEIKNEINNLSTTKKEKEEKGNKEINEKDKINNQSVFSAKTFSDLKINEYLKKALLKNGYDTMTKIQKKSIPILLEHKNVVVKSETGSGKTLAYVIPLYEYLININKETKINRKDGVHCIIFSPTHELCLQIEETFNKLKSCCINVVYGSLMGGQKVELEKKKLRKGLNVIITTPGRMLHHLKNTQNINFKPLKVIIFDEADLLLSMGFEKDIKECFNRILQKDENYIQQEEQEQELTPDMFKKYKIFLISATIDNKIRQLTNYLMKGFKAVGFEQKNKKEEDEKEEQEIVHEANGLNQFYSFISDEFRLINLIAFIYNNVNSKMIIFVSTCDCVNFLSKLLTEIEIDPLYEIVAGKGTKGQDKLIKSKNMKMKLISQTVYKLHGKMKHDERKMIFNEFNKNKKAFLISTDVAARGLDFPLIDWVIHYDVNPDIKEYVNRMGRTARLDHIGNSLIFLMQNEQVLLDTCFLSVKPKMKEIVSSDILLEFVNKINKNILKTPIELKPMPFNQEVDENEKFRKKYIFAIAPIQRIIKDFIFADKENLALARHAFKSEVRSYVTFYKYQKDVFKVKALNLTRISRSFGLYKESMKMKVGNGEVVVVDHEYERTNVKAERKYKNKKIQNKLMYSEFE